MSALGLGPLGGMSGPSNKTMMLLDSRLCKIEEHLKSLSSVPKQLGTVLDVVTWLEGSITDIMSPSGRPLLQSAAVSRNPLWGRLRRHSAAPALGRHRSPKHTSGSPGGESVAPTDSRRTSRRKGTGASSSIAVVKDFAKENLGASQVKAALFMSSPLARTASDKSPRQEEKQTHLNKSRSFDLIEDGRHSDESDPEPFAVGDFPPSKAQASSSRRGSRCSSAPPPKCRFYLDDTGSPKNESPQNKSEVPSQKLSVPGNGSAMKRRHSLGAHLHLGIGKEQMRQLHAEGMQNNATGDVSPQVIYEKRLSQLSEMSRQSERSFYTSKQSEKSHRMGKEYHYYERRSSNQSEAGISISRQTSEKSIRSFATQSVVSASMPISSMPPSRSGSRSNSRRRPSVSDITAQFVPLERVLSERLSCRISGEEKALGRVDSNTSFFAGQRWRNTGSFKSSYDGQDLVVPSCMLLPLSPVRLSLDVVTMMVTTVTSIIMPMSLVYLDSGFLSDDTLSGMSLITDLVWILYIVANFRTGIFYQGTMILDPCFVATRYTRSWCGLDLLMAIPVVFFSQGSTFHTVVQVLKLLRLLTFFPIFARLQKRVRSRVLLPIKLILGVTLTTHLMACFWRAALRADRADHDHLEKWHVHYLRDLYWVYMTMTTVGYGDIYPTGSVTRAYAIIVMLFASMFFGATITTLSHFTRSLFNDEVEERILKSSRFLKKRHVPKNLQHRVVSNLRHHLNQSHQTPTEIFSNISPALQRELSLSFLAETVLRFPLFKAAHRSCVAELAQAHLWVECFPNDLVSEPGQIVQEVCFVVHGQLVALCPPGGELDVTVEEALSPGFLGGDLMDEEEQAENIERNGVDVELNAGAWFGEACLLSDEERIRVAAVMSVVESELAILKEKDYKRILGMFPQLMKQHHSLQSALHDGLLTLKDLKHKPRHHPTLVRSGTANSTFSVRKISLNFAPWRSNSNDVQIFPKQHRNDID